MTGVTENPGTSHGAGHTAPDWGPAQGDVAALIRTLCSQGLRRGVRVVAENKRGHIFFDQGHVVHAEFGEDVGLGAVIEMLHSGAVEFRPCARPWPSQPSLFFTAEKLLAATRPGASNLITGVRRRPGASADSALDEPLTVGDLPAFSDPLSLPDPEPLAAPVRAEPTHSEPARAKTLRSEPVRAKALRSEPAKAPRPDTSEHPSSPGATTAAPALASPASAAATAAAAPLAAPAVKPAAMFAPASAPLPSFSTVAPGTLDAAVTELSRAVAAAAASHRSSTVARSLPASVARGTVARGTVARGTVARGTVADSPVISSPVVTNPGASNTVADGAVVANPGTSSASAGSTVVSSTVISNVSGPIVGSPILGRPVASPPVASGPVTGGPVAGGAVASGPFTSGPSASEARARTPAPRSQPAAQAAPAVEREAAAPPRPRVLPVTWVRRNVGVRPSVAPPSGRILETDGVRPAPSPPEQLSTTMVRVSGRGVLLAARGEECERLANAAAFIHNQAKLIAADLGRHGRTAVHLKGGGLSLLVVKSEVNDIAAALGPTERLRSLLRKVGLG